MHSLLSTSSILTNLCNRSEQWVGLRSHSVVSDEVRWTWRANIIFFLNADIKKLYTTEDGSHIFSIEHESKSGYNLSACHGWFHLQRLPIAVRKATRAKKTLRREKHSRRFIIVQENLLRRQKNHRFSWRHNEDSLTSCAPYIRLQPYIWSHWSV